MNLSIHNITFSYNGWPVLDEVTEEIGKGSFVAIVGPNGSGKSTLLRCIDGILKPQKGRVLLEEKDIHHLDRPSRARTFGYVPQESNHTPPATVFDAVLMGRKPYIGWRVREKDKQITSRIIHQLNIEDIAMKDVNKLSGGQRQRVFIARALAQQPEILLLDEPTANLDLRHQLEVLQLLGSVSQDNITTLVAIHDLNLAAQYCSHFIMLKEGKIFSSGGREILTKENIEALYDIEVNIFHADNKIFFVPAGKK
ncbi:MAG: ABC transporter ATP-binding protein [Bacteroidales bacterium]|nr:ABC transporter ATP-binding protein [Bacteroidales bacterium]